MLLLPEEANRVFKLLEITGVTRTLFRLLQDKNINLFGGATEFRESFVAAYLVALKGVLQMCVRFLFFNYVF